MRKKIAKILTIGSLVVSTLAFSSMHALAVVNTGPFGDVTPYHIYANEIQYIKENNITQGFSDNTYRPEVKIDRKSLITLLIKAKYPLSEINSCIQDNGFEGKNIFNDIPSNHHFAQLICMAKVKQISAGYSDNTFRPDNGMEIPVATTLVMRILDKNLDIPSGSSLDTYLNRLRDKGAFPMPTLGLDYQGKELNRGEVAYLIQMILDDYAPLPPEEQPQAYTFTIKPRESHTWAEQQLTMQVRNFGIHCTTTKNTFIDLQVYKGSQSPVQIHLERSCTGISDSIIQGESTHEADAFGHHFKLEEVREPIAWDITNFLYTISIK